MSINAVILKQSAFFCVVIYSNATNSSGC